MNSRKIQKKNISYLSYVCKEIWKEGLQGINRQKNFPVIKQ